MISMKTITSTEARQSFSSVISAVENEPVAISKQDKDVAVIISSARYRELKKLEDILYGKAAELAIQEGFASDKQAQDLLDSL
jgi:prevent-host-death family protein